MSRVALVIIRLSLIVAGYALAALTASLFVHFIAWPVIAPIHEDAPWLVMGGLFVSIPLVALFASYFTFVPAAVLIGLSELRGYRSWLFHALSGGAAALAALLLARQTQDAPMPDAYGELPLVWTPEVMAAAVAAGLAGGLAYWLVAGRSAGRWFGASAPARSGSSPQTR